MLSHFLCFHMFRKKCLYFLHTFGIVDCKCLTKKDFELCWGKISCDGIWSPTTNFVNKVNFLFYALQFMSSGQLFPINWKWIWCEFDNGSITKKESIRGEFLKRSIFLQKLCRTWDRETSSRPLIFLKKHVVKAWGKSRCCTV